MDSLNNICGPQAIGVVPTCPYLPLGGFRAVGILVCYSLIKRMIRGCGPWMGQFVYQMCAHRAMNHLLSLVISQPWERQSHQNRGPKCQNIKNTQNKKIVNKRVESKLEGKKNQTLLVIREMQTNKINFGTNEQNILKKLMAKVLAKVQEN